MGWVPDSAWLTKLEINSSATDLKYDLAVDTTDARSPSRVAAGLELPAAPDLPSVLAAEDDNSGGMDRLGRGSRIGRRGYWHFSSPAGGQRTGASRRD